MKTKVPLTIEDLLSQQEEEEKRKKLKKQSRSEYEKRLRYDMQHQKYTPPKNMKNNPLLKQDPAVYGGGLHDEADALQNEEIKVEISEGEQ